MKIPRCRCEAMEQILVSERLRHAQEVKELNEHYVQVTTDVCSLPMHISAILTHCAEVVLLVEEANAWWLG